MNPWPKPTWLCLCSYDRLSWLRWDAATPLILTSFLMIQTKSQDFQMWLMIWSICLEGLMRIDLLRVFMLSWFKDLSSNLVSRSTHSTFQQLQHVETPCCLQISLPGKHIFSVLHSDTKYIQSAFRTTALLTLLPSKMQFPSLTLLITFSEHNFKWCVKHFAPCSGHLGSRVVWC